jgi:hypothetical protein
MASPCHCPVNWPAEHAVSDDAFRGILEPFGDEATAKEAREDSHGERRRWCPESSSGHLPHVDETPAPRQSAHPRDRASFF